MIQKILSDLLGRWIKTRTNYIRAIGRDKQTKKKKKRTDRRTQRKREI